ncbi:tail fiber protein [Synechococcus phage S-CAM8]|uniref:Tail fiber protein n=1 Tax=Synechococcus phage S-CAM8 TaxID=754038 RepID=A0A1D8KMR8_9CAUD|nr:tail fiber protein [Synechococcus phage S-CAM8]
MSLTRLKNIITSRTGRIIYVNPDDFDASDAIDNRGNSALRPFKSLQRAFLEVARFSYRVGLSNDEFDAFSIMLYPAEYIVDNRPGEVLYTNVAPIDSNSNLDLTSPNNVLYKFNSVEGGIIVPRGCSLVGTDLRRTKIIPKYVPYPTSYGTEILEGQEPPRTSIFKVTGGTYFWQFSFFDGAEEGVYYRPDSTNTLAPKFSHHRLTCFEFADGLNSLSQLITDGNVPSGDYSAVPNILERTDLEIYYQKISKAFATIPDTSGDPATDQIQARVEENRIVGPISDEYRILQITRNGQTATAVTVDELDNPRDHGFSVGVNINISGVTGSTGPNSELDVGRYNGSFTVTSASGNVFTYQMQEEPSGNAVGSNITVKTEIDTVDSASPYAFNLSLRSVWGMNGMHADGSKATGFKSMVVAQFTGLSLQKDDRAFVRYNASTGNYDAAVAGDGAHLDGFAEYRKGWAHEHIKCSNDSFIQAVSVFAVGYGTHFTALSGADMSITNSNSNFGNTALRSAGFKAKAFSKDKAGEITHIIPPKALNVISTSATGTNGASTITLTNDGSVNGVLQGMIVSGENIGSGATVGSVNTTTGVVTLTASNTGTVNGNVIFGEETSINWVNVDIQRTKVINQALSGQGGTPGTRLYLFGYQNETSPPTTRVQGYTIGARQDGIGVNAVADKINVQLVAQGATEPTVQSASISPYGPSVSGLDAGVAGSPLQFDSATYTISGVAGSVGGWYLTTSATNNAIYQTIANNSGAGGTYQNIAFTPTTFIKRIPDSRDLQDRTYRVRYVIDKDKSNPLPRDPLSGYVVQPLNTDTTSYKLQRTFYIYDIEIVQEFERGISDGIYYLTLLCASIAPSTSNFNDRKFSQNVNEVYPTFDRDNPLADPDAAISVADNETIGLVSATDGASPTPNKDPKLSITKEGIQFLLTDTGWELPGTEPAYESVPKELSNVRVTARAGNEETRKINIRQNAEGVVAPIPVELRRHSIMRSGNHTFEYLGFGPGNYSTAFPQTQVETLSADQIKFSQSIKEEAGVAFYSGLNSNGDLFIGNQIINPVTGQITNEDVAQLNVVGEENTTIETFSELVLTDKLTVIGGASNQLESIFAGPVTFQGQLSSTNNIIAKKITYNNQDGTVIKQTLLAPEDANGQPNFTNISGYDTPADGDLVYNINWNPGKSLGWIYYEGTWYEFGLTDVGDLNIVNDNGTTRFGLGVAPLSPYVLNVGGSTRVDGDLVVTGRGGVGSDKYVTKSYTGDGSTLTFAVTTYTGGIQHTDDSVLVFLNGVAQIAGTNYTVDSNGANVVFSSGDAPQTTDTVHILELPI